MGRPADERVTGTLAREICEREHIKAMLSGSIAALGTEVVVALMRPTARPGTPSPRASHLHHRRKRFYRPSAKRRPACEESSESRWRRSKGSNTPSLTRLATTSSLGNAEGIRRRRPDAIGGSEAESLPLFQRAVALDPNFAMAYARMSAIYSNLGEEDRAVDTARKGFALRDRVSERERSTLTTTSLYGKRRHRKDKETLETAIRTYPNDSSAYTNLALQYAVYYGAVREGAPAGK